ncbi:MAG: sensor histidine kinase [Puia sp.]|nr:sensor histidine kinase [Puia sp.]
MLTGCVPIDHLYAQKNPVNAQDSGNISGRPITTANSTPKDAPALRNFHAVRSAIADTGLPSDTGRILDLARVRYLAPITARIHFFARARSPRGMDSIPGLAEAPLFSPEMARGVAPGIIEKEVYLQFPLSNSGDTTVRVYFFPGLFISKMEIFRLPGRPTHTAIPVKDLILTGPSDTGFLPITVSAHDTAWFVARMRLARTPVNSLVPQVVENDFMPYFKNRLQARRANISLMTYLTSGILLMMIFYSMAVYIQSLNREFLYYSLYAGLMGIMLFLESYLSVSTTPWNYFFQSCLDFLIQGGSMFCYFLFIRKFLDTRESHPFLEKVLVVGQVLLVCCLLLFSVFYFFTDRFVLPYLIENITKQLLLVSGIIFIVYGLIRKDDLMNYLVAGIVVLIIFSIASFLMIITRFHPSPSPTSIFNNALMYYEIGLVFELICFLSGLAYKNRREIIERVKERERLKLENERKELEKQLAVLEAQQDERDRISRDMHDELGSGVTAIRLMSEIVKSKMKEKTLPEVEKISNSANELLNKMNTIIWTMSSSNDSLENLISYIRVYAVEFFENTAIECHFNLPVSIPPTEINGDKRRNIFLSIKEALNNVLKHSQGTLVRITVLLDDRLTIEIADNGVGINMEKMRKFGNGLNNMKKRMAGIDGDFSIDHEAGTRARFSVGL